jgi:hypothetical protein
MKLECLLQDVLEVLSIGLVKRLTRIPLGYLESGIVTCRALSLNRDIPEPSRHAQSRLLKW